MKSGISEFLLLGLPYLSALLTTPNVRFIVQPMVFLAKYRRIASEEVVLQLIKLKCIPVLLYGLEVCNLAKRDLQSLDFTVNRFFMKLFQTSNIEIVKECQNFFDFVLPSVLLSTRMQKFVLTNNVDPLW